jgi:predicted Zn finger-like uncharacterized protein
VRIACVKCSTLYELDERLIPPSGAPVQCTRCGYVFTAKPTPEAAPPKPPPSTAPVSVQAKPSLSAKAPPSVAQAPAEARPSAPKRAGTQMFGALVEPGPATKQAPASPASTGAPTSAARARTQMFGAPQTDLEDISGTLRQGTQIFGSPLPRQSPAPATSAPAAGATRIFGSLSKPTDAAAQPARRIPPAPVERPPMESIEQAVGAQAASIRGGTQIFGSPLAAPRGSAPTAPRSSTERFGAIDLEGDDPARGGTLPFSATSSKPSHASADLRRSPTPLFGNEAMPTAGAKSEQPSMVTLPAEELGEARSRGQRRRASVELPAAPPLFDREPEDDPGIAIRAQIRGRNRTMLAAVAIAVALLGVLTIRAAVKHRSAIPAAVLTSEENALKLLRRDDQRSRRQAIDEIESLAQRYPQLASPAAIRLLALSLDLDDVKLGVKRIQAQSDEVSRSIARLQDRRSTGDWEARMTAARAQFGALKKESDALTEEANAIDRKLNGAYSALLMAKELQGSEQSAAIRAQAVYYGVRGSDKALGFLGQYRQLGAGDGWDAIAQAEYVLNAAHVPDATLAEARTSSERIRSTDSAFLRAYVLAARIALGQKDYDAAATLLEAVVALNPSHEIARQLIAWVDDAKHTETVKPDLAGTVQPEMPGTVKPDLAGSVKPDLGGSDSSPK